MKFVRLDEIFRVSEELEPEVEEVGNERHRVVTVPNFYARPELVRRFILETPCPIYKRPGGSKSMDECLIGRQSMRFWWGYEAVPRAIGAVIRSAYGVALTVSSVFTTGIIQLERPAPAHGRPFPHQDSIKHAPDAQEKHPQTNAHRYNALIYLNTKRECKGGTAFYRDRATGMESVPEDPARYRYFWEHIARPDNYQRGREYWHQSQSKTWERFHLCPMVYNTLVIFPACVFHSAWQLPHWFVKYPRLTQTSFVNPNDADD